MMGGPAKARFPCNLDGGRLSPKSFSPMEDTTTRIP